LQSRRADQVAPPAEDARRLRTADRLAAAIGDQVGPGGDEGMQVVPRRQFARRIDQDRQPAPPRDGDDFCQGRLRSRRLEDLAPTVST